MNYNDILQHEPFSLGRAEKRKLLSEYLNQLTEFHYEHCEEYHRVLEFLGYDKSRAYELEDQIFIPIRLFKELELKSIETQAVFKVMTSSGTTGQKTSKIYLDRENALNQQKTLVKIMSDFLEAGRLPMIIIDTERVVRDANFFSARKAGILGFSLFASDKMYALDDEMNLKVDEVERFLEKHKGRSVFLFGYTYIIWQYFYETLKNSGRRLDLSAGRLLHGGGWKKLQNLNLSDCDFRDALKSQCNIDTAADYYGMVEQTGTIYMSCEYGHMHTSTYSDIIVRNRRDFSACSVGEKGIIQLISLIPSAYPGHNILTEDEGVILGEDDCPCGRKGKYFRVLGRLQNAEVRGCSDTYERK